MPTITLPDGNNLDFPKKVTGLQIAEKISKSLAKQAMIISVNGELKDLNHVIENDCTVKIFTSKNDEGLETIRHDTAHILAMAVQELFPGNLIDLKGNEVSTGDLGGKIIGLYFSAGWCPRAPTSREIKTNNFTT